MEDVKTIFVDGSYSHEIKIPALWEFAPLHEVIELVGGSQPPKSVFKYEPEDGYVRLIQIRDYKSDSHKVYIPRDSARRFVSPDEVMIGRYGPPIFQILRGLEGAYNVALMKAVPVCDVFSNDYLFKYLSNKDLYNYVDSASDRTAGQSGVNKEHLEKYPVAVPPLAEQQQIAQKLDELLAQVNTLKTRLDAIPNTLKRFRQSVLAAAVSGRLTEEWRGEKKLEAPTDKPLKEMIVTLDQGWSPKCLSEVGLDDDWAVIKTSSVQKVNFVKDENKKLPASFDARPELSLKKGDVLITRAGPRVRCGVTCLVTKDHPKLMICDKVYRIRTNSEVLMPEYLNFLFNSPQYLEVIEELKTGSSESGMNMTMKKLVEIILLTPSVVEQLEIIKLVEKLFTYADQIEQRVKDAQARVNHLTQSILAKAFRGELTADWRAQNPELISGENSAAALLERIKAEREDLEGKKGARKPKLAAMK